jgi:Na+-translocating ferredoxin:NAD+ oxidoreductase subunit C
VLAPRPGRAALLVRHPAPRLAQRSEADCPGAVRYAPGVAACRLLPAAPEEVQSESAAPLRAAAQAEVSGPARLWPAADRVRHPREAMACRRAQPSVRRAQGRHQLAASAQRAVSQPRAASWHAAVAEASQGGAAAGVRQPEVPVVAEEPRQVAGALRAGAAAVPRPAAEQAAAGGQRRAAEAGRDAAAAALQPEVAPGAEVLPRAAPGEALAARPSAAAWAAPPCLRAAGRPGPSAAARLAHAMRG